MKDRGKWKASYEICEISERKEADKTYQLDKEIWKEFKTNKVQHK